MIESRPDLDKGDENNKDRTKRFCENTHYSVQLEEMG